MRHRFKSERVMHDAGPRQRDLFDLARRMVADSAPHAVGESQEAALRTRLRALYAASLGVVRLLERCSALTLSDRDEASMSAKELEALLVSLADWKDRSPYLN